MEIFNSIKSIIKKLPSLIVAFVAISIPFFVKAQDLSLGLEYAGSTGLGTRDLRDIVVSGIQIVLGLIGLILLVLVIYSGYLIMTAGGDETKIKKGKKIITAGAVGLVVIFSAYAIVTFIFGRLIDATGGGLGNNGNGCTGDGCNVVGGGVNFQPAKIYPSGQLPIRNVVVNVRFNKNVKPESVTEKAVSIKRQDGESSTVVVPVTVSLVENNHLVIKPKTLCPNSTTAYCFDYDDKDVTKNKHTINLAFNTADAVIDINGKKLNCLPAGKCQSEFIVGADIDLEGPKTDIVELKNTLDPFEVKTVNPNAAVSTNGAFVITATAQDKSGVSDVSFYEKTNESLFKYIGTDATTEFTNYFTAKSGPPGLWQTTDYAIDSQHNLITVATDNAGNISTSTDASITIRPRHCFNNQLDGEGDPDVGVAPDQPETAVDCGGVCGACAGVSCKKDNTGEQCVPNNSACSSFSCDSQSCLCALKPEITEISLDNGAPGNWVTIIGKNFGSEIGSVTINGQPMEVLFDPNCSKSDNWNDNYVIVVVPTMTPGIKNVSLFTNKGILSNRVDFTINNIKRPGICALDKAQYEIGENFKIVGQQFGLNTDARDVVLGKIDEGVSAENQTYQVSQVSAKVPNVQPGKMAVSVKVNNQSSNTLPIKINLSAENQLKIINVAPLTGATGQYVTITGQGFGNLKADSQVFFADNVLAEFDFPKQCGTSYWSNNQIIAKVPSVSSNLKLNEVIKIKVGNQSASSTEKFLINNNLPAAPGLCSINPKVGEVGSEVEVAGDNLLNTNLKFNSATQGITITGKNGGKYAVPTGSQTGEVKAINIANPAFVSNPLSFEVKQTASQFNGKADYYQWQFKTCADCYRPRVIVNRQCANSEIASPTPRDGSKDNFVDAVTSVVFDRAMDQNSLNGDGIIRLENCRGGDEIDVKKCQISQEASLSAVVNSGLINEPSTVVINKSDVLRGGIWYRITISKDAKSIDGVTIGQPYSWSFKTRLESGLCEVDKLSCTPPSLSLPFTTTANLSAYAYNSATCNVCPNAGTWSWSAVNSSVIVTPGIGNLASVVGVEKDSNTGVKAANSVYQNLEPGMCKINVIAPAPKVVVDAKCDTDVQSPSPFVDATKVCPRALIAVRFSEIMKGASLTTAGAVTVKNEKNLNVPLTLYDFISNEQGKAVGVIFEPTLPFTTAKKYNVILDSNILESEAGVFLSASSISNWSFTVGDDADCQIKDIIVNPGKITLPIGETRMYTALTVGNSCQLIVPASSGWQWRSTAEDVATINNSIAPKAAAEAVGAGVTYIRAKFANKENKGINGLLMSTPGAADESFKIVKVEPIGENICTNALARITFSRPINPQSVRTVYQAQDANVKMKRDGKAVPITAIVSADKTSVTLVTGGNFVEDERYDMFVTGGDAGIASFDGKKLSQGSCVLQGLSWNEPTLTCNWFFDTSSALCPVGSIVVNPKNASLTVDDAQDWQASVYSPVGVLLNDKSNWSVNDAGILSLIGNGVPSYVVTSTAMAMGRTQIKAAAGAIEQSANVEVKSKAIGPMLSVVQPTSPPPACLNSLIKAKFDSPINVASLNNNVSVVYQGENCVENPNRPIGDPKGMIINKNGEVSWMPKSTFNKTFYKLLSVASKYLGGEILNSITNLVARKVLADNPWCEVAGTWQVTGVEGEQEVVFTQSQILPQNSTVRVVFNGGNDGIKGINELNTGITPGILGLKNFSNNQYGWEFVTSSSVCKVAYVDVYGQKNIEKKDWAFSRSDNDTSDDYPDCSTLVCDKKNDGDKVFDAVAKTAEGMSVISIDNVYSWRWSWNSSDLSVAGIGAVEKPVGTVFPSRQMVRAENKNGESNITATAVFSPNANQGPITGTAKATVFLCANPWPMVEGEWQPLDDNKYNLSFFYCRDDGAPGEQDDLPELKVPGQDNMFKYPKMLTNPDNKTLPICNRPSNPLEFCKAKGFYGVNKIITNPELVECATYTGGPIWQYISSDTTISSFNCLAGNNYIDYTTGKVGDNDMLRQYLLEVPGTNGDAVALRIYENNYQNSAADWYKFNASNPGNPSETPVASSYPVIKDSRSSYIAFANQKDPVTTPNKAEALMLVASYNQDASKNTINIVNQIMNNIKFNTNVQNDDTKSKLIRDFKRVSDLQSMANALYKTYLSVGSVPALSGGTFVPAITLSNWPSWQQTLAGVLKKTLPSDPVNKFGACSDCVNPENYNTDFEDTVSFGRLSAIPEVSYNRICTGGVAAVQGNCYGSVSVPADMQGNGVSENIRLSGNTNYKVTAKLYMASTTSDVLARLMSLDTGTTVSKDFTISHSTNDEWKDVSFEIKTTNNELYSLSVTAKTDSYTKFFLDDLKITAVGGHCADFDPATCWNPKANNNTGEFSCSSNSYSYLYKYNKAEPSPALRGKFYALAELVSNWVDDTGGVNTNLDSKINLIPSTGKLPVCTGASMGVSCGDGVVNSPEICEIGDSQPFCDAGKNWYNSAVNLCESTGNNACKLWQSPLASAGVCSGKTAAQCCGGYCGDSVLNTKPTYRINNDEQCDSSVNGSNDQKGFGSGGSPTNQYACSQTCHDVGGYCGDNTLQNQYGEQCDGVVGLSAWTCPNGTAPTCNGCRVSCGSGAPYRGLCGNNIIENGESCDYCGNGLQSVPGQGECAGQSLTSQYSCTKPGNGQCKWTGGFCGDNIEQGITNPVEGKVMEYCDKAKSYSGIYEVNKCTDDCQSFTCKAGFFDCDAINSTGCEIEGAKGLWVTKNTINAITPPNINAPTANDIADKELIDCGGCAGKGGVTCAWVPNSAPMCANGKCQLNCLNGFTDENNNYNDGCEKIGSILAGKVKKQGDGANLDGATVMLFNDTTNDKSLVGTTTTNSSGDYSINGLEKGRYSVVAYKRGFYSQKNPIIISIGGVTTKDFSLLAGDKNIGGLIQRVNPSNNQIVPYLGQLVKCALDIGDGIELSCGEYNNSSSNGSYGFSNLEKNGHYIISIVPTEAGYYEDKYDFGALTQDASHNFIVNKCGDGLLFAGKEICDGSSAVYSCKEIYGANNLLSGPINYSVFNDRDWDGATVCNNTCSEILLAGLKKDTTNTGPYTFRGLPGGDLKYTSDLSVLTGGDCSYGPPAINNEKYKIVKTKDIALSFNDIDYTQFIPNTATSTLNGKDCWFRSKDVCSAAGDPPVYGGTYYAGVYYMPADNGTHWHKGKIVVNSTTPVSGGVYCNSTDYGYPAGLCSATNSNNCNWTLGGNIYSSRLCWVKN